MKIHFLWILLHAAAGNLAAQDGSMVEVERGPMKKLNSIPAGWERLDEGPSGPSFTAYDGDTVWLVNLVRPGLFRAHFLLNEWGGDFESTPWWTTEISDKGDSLWVLHTCVAWSHTRYEQQSATKDLTTIYWRAGKEPELLYAGGGFYESRDEWLGEPPEIIGCVMNVKFTSRGMTITRASWKMDAPNQPQWETGLKILSYKRVSKGWRLETETRIKNEMSREEAMQWMQVPESQLCQFWFEETPVYELR